MTTSAPARSLVILGATGSVGRQALDLVETHENRFRVVAMTAAREAALMIELARRHRPSYVAMADAAAAATVRAALAPEGIEVGEEAEGLSCAAGIEADCVVAGIVGTAGLPPVFEAIRHGRTIAFASKECLVSAGSVMLEAVKASGARLLPVDSEHSALFQLVEPHNRAQVERLILTGSGGPFRTATREEMARANPAEAMAHPVWSMGAKISVDSATMMNKALEIIEAAYLFDMPHERIEVLIHPQALVHALVDYADGSTLAHLGAPDMRTPLAVALAWPERIATPVARLDLAKLGQLNFHPPDPEKFPALRLAREALMAGPPAPAIMNAANEEAVAAFMAGRIGLLQIATIVAECLAQCDGPVPETLDDVLALDARARETARRLIEDAD